MGLEPLIERIGENWTLAAAGLTIGLAFGFLAQRSRFCLRSAVIEFSRNVTGGKLTVWLFAFATAVLATQWLVLAAQGSLRSVISGLVFAVSAQAAWTGMLSPLRVAISEWWTVDGGASRDLVARTGLSGAAVFTITSWITLCSMWAAAALTDRLLDQRPAHHLDQAMPGHTEAHATPASA